MWQRILHFPLTKILLGLILCVSLVVAGQILIGNLLDMVGLDHDTGKLVIGVYIAVISIASYYWLYRFLEKRSIDELSVKNIGKHLFYGFLIGFILQSLTILVIYLKGSYTVVSVNPLVYVIPPFTMSFTSGIFEEILMRGIVFRIAEERLGSYIALIISALIFGILHLANPNSSITMALSIAIQAGLPLGLAFIYTRNLWCPLAIHFAWHFPQSAIYGAHVSGNTISKTLITSKIEGSDWYTGGAFGPEGSLQAPIFCLIIGGILLYLCIKEGKIIKPYWSKS